MAGKGERPIIVVKKKVAGHGHHGGAWKVAYADFVTAMMAFFLLLWLLSQTTEEQRKGLADYFSPVSASTATSGSNGVMGGTVISPEGGSTQTSAPIVVEVPVDGVPNSYQDTQKDQDPGSTEHPDTPGAADAGAGGVDAAALDKANNARDDAQFAEAEQELRDAIANSDLGDYKDNLLIEQTPEGLRIQILERDKRAMFSPGSDQPTPQASELLSLVGQVIETLPQKISISGHTDASKFAGASAGGRDNWDLSTARANNSRRVLVQAGVSADRVWRVDGRADRDLLLPASPTDPQNRRISITLLRRSLTDKPGAGSDAG